MTRSRRVDDAGQTTVELALALPLVVLLAALAVQVGLTVHDQVVVTHAAREAARAAAVDPAPSEARAAALAGGGLDPERLELRLSGRGDRGDRLTAELRYRSPVRVPILRLLVREVTVSGRATMRVES
ncbi:MAG: TadE/TadG family type IV pilus assembly protein [Acidimicrobiales bacterium]